MPTISIRRAKQGEGQTLTELVLRSKASWGYDAAFMEAAKGELTITEEVIQEEDCWVAELDGKPAGFLRVRSKVDHLWLEDLFVDPEYFDKGVGTALWKHAVQFAVSKGFSEMRFESDPNARAFYDRLGAVVLEWKESTIRTGRMLPWMAFKVTH